MKLSDIQQGLYKQSEICGNTSTLYRDLLNYSSKNDNISKIIFEASQSRKFTGSLEAALTFISYINFRALEGHPISNYFQSYGGNYSENDYPEATRLLNDICLKEKNEVNNWIINTILQTNEIARCAVIYPALLSLNLKKINLIELGASAGLILYMDKFSYKYVADNQEVISKNLEPTLESKINNLSAIKNLLSKRNDLEITKRIGFDLNPISLNELKNIKLLKSAIWDSPERLARLEKAIEVFKNNQETSPVINNYADYTENLSDKILSLIDRDSDIVIYTSVSTYQIPDDLYDKLLNQLEQIKKNVTRQLYFIEFEPPRKTEHLGMSLTEKEPFILKISNIRDNESNIFAKSHFHGTSISILD